MSGRPLSRAMPSRGELIACRVFLLFILALQIETVFFQREQPTPASIVVSSADHAQWDAADPLHSKDATIEAGWLLVADALRTLTGATRFEAQAPAARLYAVQLGFNSGYQFLAVRASVDAVKIGRDASHSTTVPPPTL